MNGSPPATPAALAAVGPGLVGGDTMNGFPPATLVAAAGHGSRVVAR